jgi:hypothetical protein
MTTEAPAAQAEVKRAYEYILGRLTTAYSSRADHFRRFIERGLRAEGWFPMEALVALTGQLASSVLQVENVRGKAAGDTDFNPDLEIKIGTQSHQIAIKSLPLTPERDAAYYFSKELPCLFQWVNSLKERFALVTVAYPCSIETPQWKEQVEKAEEAHQVKVIGQSEFYVPMPPRPLQKAVITIWRHQSVAG